MKTARERAENFLYRYLTEYTESDVNAIERLLKEQDKITRHACADAVKAWASKNGYDASGVLVETARAEAACITAKAV